MENTEKRKDEVHAISVRAGKRTYFFDIKETRNGDLFLIITESKKVYEQDGSSRFEKHKVFLYKEDFDKFFNGYKEAIDFIAEKKPEYFDPENFENTSGYDDSETDI